VISTINVTPLRQHNDWYFMLDSATPKMKRYGVNESDSFSDWLPNRRHRASATLWNISLTETLTMTGNSRDIGWLVSNIRAYYRDGYGLGPSMLRLGWVELCGVCRRLCWIQWDCDGCVQRLCAFILARVNSHSRSLYYAIAQPCVCRLSVPPYWGGSNFQQYFYGIRCLGHPLTSAENFTEIVTGESRRRVS